MVGEILKHQGFRVAIAVLCVCLACGENIGVDAGDYFARAAVGFGFVGAVLSGQRGVLCEGQYEEQGCCQRNARHVYPDLEICFQRSRITAASILVRADRLCPWTGGRTSLSASPGSLQSCCELRLL